MSEQKPKDTTAVPEQVDAQPAVAPDVPGMVYVDLEEPVRRGSQEINKVGLRKPSAGELRGISLNALMELEVRALQVLLPRITSPSLTRHEVDGLSLPDLAEIGTEVGLFLLKKADRESLGR